MVATRRAGRLATAAWPGLIRARRSLQLVTAPDVSKLVEAFLHVEPPEVLSQAALKVLAIVAFQQNQQGGVAACASLAVRGWPH